MQTIDINGGESADEGFNKRVYLDIVKNITRMNDALKEVIQNYKELQRISRLQSFETDFDGDDWQKDIVKRRDNVLTTSRFPGTSLYFSEKDTSEASDSDHNHERATRKYETANKYHHFKVLNSTAVTKKSYLKKKYNKPLKKTKSGSRETDATSNGTEIKHDGEKKVTIEATMKIHREIGNDKIHRDKTSRAHNITTKIFQENFNKSIKKVVYAETFARDKMWDDIVNKKPLKLRAQNDFTVMDVSENSKRYDRQHDGLDDQSSVNDHYSTSHIKHHRTTRFFSTIMGQNPIKDIKSIMQIIKGEKHQQEDESKPDDEFKDQDESKHIGAPKYEDKSKTEDAYKHENASKHELVSKNEPDFKHEPESKHDSKSKHEPESKHESESKHEPESTNELKSKQEPEFKHDRASHHKSEQRVPIKIETHTHEKKKVPL